MIHLMVGIQGAGKSTFAKKLSKEINALIVSTDQIRMDNPGIEEKLVWTKSYETLANCLKNNQEVIFDATSINAKSRKRVFDNVASFNVKPVIGAYFFDTDLKECERRVEIRNTDVNEHHLPVEVVAQYLERQEVPTLEEGFVFVKTVKNNEVVSTIE